MPKFKRKHKRNATHAELLELKGAVKQMQQTTYKAFLKNGEPVQDKIEIDSIYVGKNFIVSFTKSGVKTNEISFGSDGKHVKLFNEDGLEIEKAHYKNGELYQTTYHTYFSNKQSKEHGVHNADGSIRYKSVKTTDDAGHVLTDRFLYGPEEKLSQETIYTYNQDGKLLSSTEYKADRSINYVHENTYNEKGLHITDKWTNTDESMKQYNRHYTYEYNEQGDCILFNIHRQDGSIESSSSYTPEYDSNGKKIERKLPDLYEEEMDYEREECELDTHGNWTKKTTFSNKSPLNIILRDIIYFDDPADKTLPPHSYTYTKPTEMTKKVLKEELMAEEDAKWMAEMPNLIPENFPLYRYYAHNFKELPSQVTYTGPNIAAEALLKELQETLSAETLHTYNTVWSGYKKPSRFTLRFPDYPGYMLHAVGLTRQNADEFIIPGGLGLSIFDDVYISQFQLLCPCENSENNNLYFNDIFEQCVDKCTLQPKPEKPFINMIEFSGTNFVLKQHAVDDNFEIRDLDINYGYGFTKFHDELMVRFNTSTKGLVLFHGEPGTGKTYYIRHLLRKMVSSKKVVIYMPPNMVDHLVEPSFMTFISTEIKELSEDGNFCVLLIEDAEPLLAKRQEGVRIQGVTNLLNMTDGLLNDMLNLQIICTFNVGLRKLDSALLRPGRLIARKEFKALSELDANLLAQRLGIKHHFTAPATLGEIYALRKHKNILIHDVEHDENASDLIDDLI